MSKFCVSDASSRVDYMMYLHDGLSPLLIECGASVGLSNDGDRCVLAVESEKHAEELILCEVQSLAAEILVVGYKYEYFCQKINPQGLTEGERELLLSALISADELEDARYVRRKFQGKKEFAIDGIFHFLLSPLREKWDEIVGYIPSVFVRGELVDFVTFLIGEKRPKTCYVDGKSVCDSTFRPLRRIRLTAGNSRLAVVRELLLAGATDVDLVGSISADDERYIRDFFGDRVTFSCQRRKATEKVVKKG